MANQEIDEKTKKSFRDAFKTPDENKKKKPEDTGGESFASFVGSAFKEGAQDLGKAVKTLIEKRKK